jgi:hypothetical protein
VLSGQRVVITAPPTPANVEALVGWSAGSQGAFLAEALTQVSPSLQPHHISYLRLPTPTAPPFVSGIPGAGLQREENVAERCD